MAISALLALAAYATNGLSGWLHNGPFFGLSLATSAGWAVCCAMLVWRFGWRGTISLLGAPLALALPLAWMFLRDSVWWACALHDFCS